MPSESRQNGIVRTICSNNPVTTSATETSQASSAEERFVLRRAEAEQPMRPSLDPSQQLVVDHPGGPLLVLAGPGTGKTTTLVESVVSKLTVGGLSADSVLVLTFSRRAAAELRDRITARLGRAAVTPKVFTFHAFCFALVRRFTDEESFGSTIRLLTAPEQEFRVRETLEGSAESGQTSWPESVARAFPTRGFAAEVRAVLAKTRQLGMDGEDLVGVGEAAGRAEWVSIGEFFDEYLDVLDAEQVLDYAELVHRCRILAADPEVMNILRAELSAVFVDEYQDTDPSQVALLQAIAGNGRDLMVVGDPDQSIYGFRGAEARGILDFPDRFRTSNGERAPIIALGQTRRFGTKLHAASRNLAAKLGIPRALPPEIFADFRNPGCAPELGKGAVEVFTCITAGAEAEHIAHLLRVAHLRDGLSWSSMAVLVRSGRRSIPALSRALTAAGVPVEVAGDEIPLSFELAIRPLLLALQVASRGRSMNATEARQLLLSPLGGLDGMGIRRLGRALRQAERDELAGTGLPRLSEELICAALIDPARLDECPPAPEIERARELATLLISLDQAILAGATAEEALWLVWTATGWPDQLRNAANHGGDQARRANRDLDAVCALFDIAARSEELSGLRGVTGFLAEVESQQIPADTLREADLRGSAVRLLTAHRAKGLEWELVVVASVQEGIWPDPRRRGTLLEPDRLSRHGLAELVPTASRIAEERRLFYVACTRARQRLVVTAVEGTEGEADQPSRFLTELGVPIQSLPGRPKRPLSLASLIGELRSVSVDPQAPPSLREAAAARLARLADLTDSDGHPIAPAANPARWWGMNEISEGDRPVVEPGAPVQLSGSQLASVLACPRQWFLARKAYGESSRKSAASFGSVIHVLAEHGATAEVDPNALSDQLEAVWDQLDFDANWLSAVERIEAESALERFTIWQEARTDRELLGVEVGFDFELNLGDERVRLTGTADRVERDASGRIRIVDFKTGRMAPTAGEMATQDQLGVYQLAVQEGAFAEVVGPDAVVGGAELVYLRLPDGTTGFPKIFEQASLADVPHPVNSDEATRQRPTWVHQRLAEAAQVIRAESFEAKIGPSCRYCVFKTSCPAASIGRQVVE